ncbi:NAD(P)/FAD-dependent oxidoreductase [Marinivivus vitaminiproducens]|uniref:NAD(P)/FAD-dependent oxidoreductase n=1 Tax=Marinivivus vitaminiproducens TaxID=3035935 RepID=UPI0027A36DE9|nr:FAD-binding oxidoreductase [Geminicoccaceae bacterium SCSIO 64248]
MAARIVIVGGGAIGSSIAYFLTRSPDFCGTVQVIERDPTYARASSSLSASSIRQQFSTPLNIELSRFGLAFMREADRHLGTGDAGVDLALREYGYLLLGTDAVWPVMTRVHGIQRGHDVEVALLSPEDLRARFPWLNTDGLRGGSLGLANEGWFDGPGLLQAFRRKARAQGAEYIAREAVGFDRRGRKVEAVWLDDGSRIGCDVLINAAGPWAGHVAARFGVDLPVRARRRVVHVFDCQDKPAETMPLTFDPTGIWFRPEGMHYVTGSAPRGDEPDPDDLPLEYDPDDFEQTFWPALAERVPAFERIKWRGAWAGYYEVNTLDHNGVVGPHPDLDNVLFANGFSGHGLQHSPGVGRAVAELVTHGAYRSLDLSPLGFARILKGEPYPEINVL